MQFGAGANHCPGADMHLAVSAKLLVHMLTIVDFKFLQENLCAVRNDMTFDEMKDFFKVKVSLPKTGPLTMPNSPLRATASDFKLETTTAPEYPPGLTSSYNPFTIAGAGFESVAKFLAALKGGKEFVPTVIDTSIKGADAIDAGCEGSPTLSNAPTLTPDHGVSDSDEQSLRKTIGDNSTALLLQRWPPSELELLPNGAVKTWAIRSKQQQTKAREMVERIWSGRLTPEFDRNTNRFWINLSRQKQQRATETMPRGVQQQPAPARAELHGAWSGFATVEHGKHADREAEGKRVARDMELYEIDKKQRAQERIEAKAAAALMPQRVFAQTFKQTSRKEADDGKLGGPRKFIEVVKTEDTIDGTVIVSEKIMHAETPIETVTEKSDKPKRDTLPPHLRLRASSPPAQSATLPENGNVGAVLATQSDSQQNSRPRSSSPPHLRAKTQTISITDDANESNKENKAPDSVPSDIPSHHQVMAKEATGADGETSFSGVSDMRMVPESVNPPRSLPQKPETSMVETAATVDIEGKAPEKKRSVSPPHLRRHAQSPAADDANAVLHTATTTKTDNETAATTKLGDSKSPAADDTTGELHVTTDSKRDKEAAATTKLADNKSAAADEANGMLHTTATTKSDIEGAATTKLADDYDTDVSESSQGGVTINADKVWVAASLPLQFV